MASGGALDSRSANDVIHRFRDRRFNGVDIESSPDRRRSWNVSRCQSTFPLDSSSGYEASMQNTSRETQHLYLPTPKVGMKSEEHLSKDRRFNSTATPTDDCHVAHDDDSGFNEEDYLAGRIFIGLVSNRLLVKNSPLGDKKLKPVSSDSLDKNESQIRRRSSSVSRVQNVVFKPYEQQSVRDNRGTSKAQQDEIYLKQKTSRKLDRENSVAQDDKATEGEGSGSNQINNAYYATNSIPMTCTERKEQGKMTQQKSSFNQKKLNRVEAGYSPNSRQLDAKQRLKEDISESMKHPKGNGSNFENQRRNRQDLDSDQSNKSNKEHKSQLETNSDNPHENHRMMDKFGNAKDYSNNSETNDTDKVYNYFLYIGTRIPSKSFSRLIRSVNQ